MRFQSYKVVLVADMEKAFLQVGLQEWEGCCKISTTENIAVLRFTRIPFGMIFSQCILAATIVHHLMKKGTAVPKKTEKDIHVDNLITGTNTERSALQIYLQGKYIFQEMLRNLRAWASNSITLQWNFKDEGKYHGKDMIGYALG